jgi:uncharacterized protein
MDNFTNETLDLDQLPKYEKKSLLPLHANYWKVLLVIIAISFLILAVLCLMAFIWVEDTVEYQPQIWSLYLFLLVVVLFFSRLSYKKKAFVFREHDLIFRHGIIATNTIVIPYNRIQHVAVHEGLIERWFGLAKVEVFTAGGTASDLGIPGIPKDKAEDIKQLLMGKIQRQL